MKTNNLYRILTDEKTLKSIKEREFKDFILKERSLLVLHSWF